MRHVLRLCIVVGAISLVLITLVMAVPRWHAAGSISPWLLYTTMASNGPASIYRVGPAGSTPQRLNADFVQVLFPSWSPDGKWIAFSASGEIIAGRPIPHYNDYSLYRMRADGRDLQKVMPLKAKPIALLNLAWSPDGRFLVWDMQLGKTVDRLDSSGQYVQAFISETFRVRVDGAGVQRWQVDDSPAGGIWEPVDLAGLPPAPFIASPEQSIGLPKPLVTQQGWLVAYRPEANPPGIYRVPISSTSSPELERDSELLFASSDRLISQITSPDGKTVMLSTMGPGGGKVFRVDVPTGSVAQVVRDSSDYHNLVLAWSPDGRWVAIEAHRSDSGGVYLLQADTTGIRTLDTLKQLAGGSDQYGSVAWAPPVERQFRWGWLLAGGVIGLALGLGACRWGLPPMRQAVEARRRGNLRVDIVQREVGAARFPGALLKAAKNTE